MNDNRSARYLWLVPVLIIVGAMWFLLWHGVGAAIWYLLTGGR